MPGKRKKPAEQRFMEKVRADGECLVWTDVLHRRGYGSFSADGRLWKAHRWAYERWVGPIPGGLTIDHLCCNKACVRIDHLEPVTNAENTRRAKERRANRCRRGHDLTLPGAVYTFTQMKRGVTYIGRQCLECRAITDRRSARRMAA
jgi:hypothetical protein